MSRTRFLCLLLVPTIIIAFLPGLFLPRSSSGDTPVADYGVYCIGDSLTAADYYEAELRTLLGDSFTVVNKGVAGDTTSGMLKRFKTDVLDQGPDSVVIWGGVNDINVGYPLGTTKSCLQSMYTQAHNAGITVIAIAMSPWKGHAKWTTLKQTTTNGLRTWIKTTAVNVDYVIDIYPLLAKSDDPDSLALDYDRGDHLHLNSTGGAVIGQAIYDAVDFVSLKFQPRSYLPANGAMVVSLTPSLESTAFSGPGVADSHSASQWQVTSTSDNCSSPVYDSGPDASNLTSITIPSGELRYSTTYYWHVRHQANNDDWSQWSTQISFRTPPMGVPALVSPANGATVTGPSAVFEWSPVAEAVNYRLVVSKSSNFSDQTAKKTIMDVGNVTSYVDTGYPVNGTKYCWWVFAFNPGGAQSPWAGVSANGRNFTNVAACTAAPTLVSPSNGVSVSGTSVTFEWSPLAEAVNYRVVVSASSNVLNQTAKKTIVDVGTATNYVDTGYSANGTKYYWWVFAYGADGSRSVWTEVSANGLRFTNTP